MVNLWIKLEKKKVNEKNTKILQEREKKKRNTFTGLYCAVQTQAFLLIYFHLFSRKK